MTRRSKRGLERRLADLDAETVDADTPPRWFRGCYADRPAAWVREEWRRTVRRSRDQGCDVMASAWVRSIKRQRGDLEGEADHP